MTPSEFCYWLQGHLEIGGAAIKTLDEKQVQMIRDHLGYVFEHAGPLTLTPEQKRALEAAQSAEGWPPPVVDSLAERIRRAEMSNLRLC